MGCRRGIYESLKRRLAKELPWLKVVDLDKGQVGRGGKNYPVPLPAAYVKLGRIDWESQTEVQEGEAEIAVTLVLEHVQDTYAGAEAEAWEMGELDKEEALYAALEGYSSEAHGGLDRRKSQPPDYREGMLLLESEWVCRVVQAKPGRREEVRLELKVKS